MRGMREIRGGPLLSGDEDVGKNDGGWGEEGWRW